MAKVAIIDDDFNESITLNDILKADDDNILDALEDKNSFEYEDISACFKNLNLEFKSLQDFVNLLNSTLDLSSLPTVFLQLKNRVLDRKKLLVAPVERIIDWLCNSGLNVTKTDIDIFSSPLHFFEKNISICYELICVDYLLVNDSEKETIPFIKNIKDLSEQQGYTPSFILMSSHEDLIAKNFLDIKSSLSMTSSRFRIMEKPSTDLECKEIIWRTTFKQIFEQKKFIQYIEHFIHNWIEHFTIASGNLSKTLWALDAHSLDVLCRTAKDDNVSFSDYFTEVIFKKVLAEFEDSLNTNSKSVRATGDVLQNLFEDTNIISPGNEVRDSRFLLKTLLKNSNWHEKNWYQSLVPYPTRSLKSIDLPAIYYYQMAWIKENLRFGIVLRHKENKSLLVNLTQPCDTAHIKLQQIDKINLLFMHGTDIHMSINNSSTTDKQALSTALYLDSGWRNIRWDLSRPMTPPINLFIENLEDYEIIGQLRQEQTQHILNRYVAKISRIATIRMPYLFDIKYIIVSCDDKEKIIIHSQGDGHAIKASPDSLTINFSPEQANIIQSTLNTHTNIFGDLVGGLIIPNKRKLKLPPQNSHDNIYVFNQCLSIDQVLEKIEKEHKKVLTKSKDIILFIYND